MKLSFCTIEEMMSNNKLHHTQIFQVNLRDSAFPRCTLSSLEIRNWRVLVKYWFCYEKQGIANNLLLEHLFYRKKETAALFFSFQQKFLILVEFSKENQQALNMNRKTRLILISKNAINRLFRPAQQYENMKI